jgi:hypothetical protein
VQACPLLVSRLRSNPQWLTTVVEKFLSLATSKHYIDRQGFLKICSAFLSSDSTDKADDDAYRPFFIAHLSTAFFQLSKDPVLNVRVVFTDLAISHQGMAPPLPTSSISSPRLTRDAACSQSRRVY